MRDQGRCWRGCGAGAQVVIFDNDQDDRLLVVQEALSEAMASAAYDGPLACVRVRLSLPPPPVPRPPIHRRRRRLGSGSAGLALTHRRQPSEVAWLPGTSSLSCMDSRVDEEVKEAGGGSPPGPGEVMVAIGRGGGRR